MHDGLNTGNAKCVSVGTHKLLSLLGSLLTISQRGVSLSLVQTESQGVYLGDAIHVACQSTGVPTCILTHTV